MQAIKSFGWFAAMVFAIAMALRLARFNVGLDDPNKPTWSSYFFTGMPAPAGAIVALLPLYLHLSALGLVFDNGMVAIEIVYLLCVAGLMASRIPHFSGKSIGRVPREQVIPILFCVAALVLLLITFPMEVLAVLTLAFVGLIPFSIASHRRYQRRGRGARPGRGGREGRADRLIEPWTVAAFSRFATVECDGNPFRTDHGSPSSVSKCGVLD